MDAMYNPMSSTYGMGQEAQTTKGQIKKPGPPKLNETQVQGAWG